MQTYINISDADAMYNSLVSELISNGHQVTVVSSNEGRGKTNLIIEGKAEVLRVKTLPFLNTSPFIKGLANLLLPYQYRIAINKLLRHRRYDIIFTPTPPITLSNLARDYKKKYHAKLFLILRDIFPQNAVDLGMINPRGLIYHYFRRKEKDLYDYADFIGCMTRGNLDYLISKNPKVDSTKLYILPNWIKPTIYLPPQKELNILQNLNFQDKFIVVYGGNLGLPQKVENIIEIALLHEDKKDLIFIVVGKGTHKDYLGRIIHEKRIKNVILIDFMKRNEYELLVSRSHIGFISLNENFTVPNIPYRTLTYYNFKKPIFAIVDPHTDYRDMVEEDGSGFCCIHGDINGYIDRFNELYYNSELRERMGENGYKALMEKYTSGNAYKRIAEIMSF